jgi:hypothetical protein
MDSSSVVHARSDGWFVARLDGAGSIWSIANELETGGDIFRIRVTGGATLENGDARFTNGFAGHTVEISGSGSLWRSTGDLSVKVGTGSLNHFDIRDGGSMLVEGDATIDYRTSVSQLETSVRDAASLIHIGGTFSLIGRQLLNVGGAIVTNRLLVENGGRAEAGLRVEAFLGAEIALHGGTLATPLVSLQGGRLIGDGLVDGDVTNAGRVAPAADGGALEITGDFAQTSDGTLVITLGGTQAGIDHALLDVLGTSLLAGALEVELAAGFAPSSGDVFEVLRAGALLGAFASFAGLDVGGGVTLVPHYESDSFSLVAVPEPASGALVACGLAVLVRRARRRQGSSA